MELHLTPVCRRDSHAIFLRLLVRGKSIVLSELTYHHVIVHRHKDEPSFEVVRMRIVAPEHRLNFEEKLSRCVSWVHPPLEHHWLSGEFVELKMFWGANGNQHFFGSPAFLLIVEGGFHFPPGHNTESLKTYTFAGSSWGIS